MVRGESGEATGVPAWLHLHGDAFTDEYAAVRDWFAIVALIILFIVAGIEAVFIKHNADVVDALNAQNAALQVAQAQSSAQFRIFLKEFTAENNYDCQILTTIAHIEHLALPPADGTCAVQAP
jgi:hypothetical protein